MSDYFGYRTGIKGTIHIKHTPCGSFIEKGISPLNFIEKQYALGNIKPTYPLPAIVYEAVWDDIGEPFIVRIYKEGCITYEGEVLSFSERVNK